MTFKQMVLVAMITPLVACGGGGGSSEEEPEPINNPGGGPEATADMTQDLEIQPDFDIQSTWKMLVDVDAPTTGAGFLSVCSGYASTATGFDIDFDSCPIRASINNGTFDGEIVVSNDVTRLVAAIYFLDETTAPVYREFQIANGQASITWD